MGIWRAYWQARLDRLGTAPAPMWVLASVRPQRPLPNHFFRVPTAVPLTCRAKFRVIAHISISKEIYCANAGNPFSYKTDHMTCHLHHSSSHQPSLRSCSHTSSSTNHTLPRCLYAVLVPSFYPISSRTFRNHKLAQPTITGRHLVRHRHYSPRHSTRSL